MGPVGGKLPPQPTQLTRILDPKTLLLVVQAHSLADISREFSSDQRAGHGPEVEIHGDHGGHVTEQAKSQARTRSAQGLLARSREQPQSHRGSGTRRNEEFTLRGSQGGQQGARAHTSRGPGRGQPRPQAARDLLLQRARPEEGPGGAPETAARGDPALCLSQ